MNSILQKLIQRQRLILILLFFISLILRLGFTFAEYNRNGTNEWADAKTYLHDGLSFAEGDFYPKFSSVYPFMIEGPVLPLVVAFSQILTNDPIIPVLILNCLLSALLVFVLFELGRELMGVLAGLILALWSVFNIDFIRFNFQIGKEPLLIILLPLILLLVLKIYRQKRLLLDVCLSAIMFSILIHLDERFIVFGPVLLFLIICALSKQLRFIGGFIWVLILVSSMIPWTIRNYIEHKQIVILTPRMTTATSVLWGKDLANLNFTSDKNIEQFIQWTLKEARRAEKLYGVSPRRFGKYERYYKNFISFWRPSYFKLSFVHTGYEPVKWSMMHNASSIIFYGVYLPFYLFGLIHSLARKNFGIFILGAIPVYYSCIHTILLIWPLERYRVPFNFIVVLVALWTVQELYKNYFINNKTLMRPVKVVKASLLGGL